MSSRRSTFAFVAKVLELAEEMRPMEADMQEGVGEAQRGSSECARSVRALATILAGVAEVAQEIAQIAAAVEERTATTNEISNEIIRIDSITRASLGLTRRAEPSAAIREVSSR